MWREGRDVEGRDVERRDLGLAAGFEMWGSCPQSSWYLLQRLAASTGGIQSTAQLPQLIAPV